MNIITKPSVHLITRQHLNAEGVTAYLREIDQHWSQTTPVAAENAVEMAGRVCYQSFSKPRPGGNSAYIKHILEVGHGSVLEHAVFGLLITGVSRSLTHELIRHRAGFGFSQLSQRFVDESDCSFVLPPGIVEQSLAATIWLESIEFAQKGYAELVETLELHEFASEKNPTLRRKRAREAARSVLPNATATQIFVTGNARAWRHFIELRGSIHADAEIRRLAVAVAEVLFDEAPNLFGDYTVDEQGEIQTDYRKV